MCVDQDRLLYHFLVEGTVIKDGSKVQCDVSDYEYLLLQGLGRIQKIQKEGAENIFGKSATSLYTQNI